MKLERIERAQIKSLMQDDRWNGFEKAVALYLAMLREEKIGGQNEFETLRALHSRDGKIEGINGLLKELEENVAT